MIYSFLRNNSNVPSHTNKISKESTDEYEVGRPRERARIHVITPSSFRSKVVELCFFGMGFHTVGVEGRKDLPVLQEQRGSKVIGSTHIFRVFIPSPREPRPRIFRCVRHIRFSITSTSSRAVLVRKYISRCRVPNYPSLSFS